MGTSFCSENKILQIFFLSSELILTHTHMCKTILKLFLERFSILVAGDLNMSF